MNWWHDQSVFPQGLLNDKVTCLRRSQYIDENFVGQSGEFFQMWRNELNNYKVSKQSFENFKLLQNKEALVITTGQQGSIAGGPLLVFYKALSCVQQAQYLTIQMKRPVVPVFWIAGDDSDFDECNQFENLSKDQGFQFTNVLRKVNEPVSKVRLSDSDINEWKLFLSKNELSNQSVMEQKLSDYFEHSNSLVEAFGHLIAQIFSNEGLLIIDGGGYAVRSCESKILSPFLSQHDSIQKELNTQSEFLKTKNINTQVPLDPSKIRLFELVGGVRVRVYQGMSVDAQCIVHDALSRPFLLEGLFPILGHVLGPAELKYFALVQKLFPLLKIQSPLVIKRTNLTLIRRLDLKLSRELEVDPSEILTWTYSKIASEIISAKYHSEIKSLSTQKWNWPEHSSISEKVRSKLDFKKGKLFNQLIESQKKEWLAHSIETRTRSKEVSLWFASGRVQERVMNIFEAVQFFNISYLKRSIDALSEEHQLILEPINE